MLDYCLNHREIVFLVALIVAFAATGFALIRILPIQNALAVLALTAFVAEVFQTIGVKTGFPFGPFFYTEIWSYPLVAPWYVPLIWVVTVLNSRGVARLILRPWREGPNYGIWSIGLTCFLATTFAALLEPLVSRTCHFWIWQTHRTDLTWYGASWVNFLGWAATTLLIMGIIMPWLIDKKAVKNPPPDYPPFALWLLMTVLLTIVNGGSKFWVATAFGVILSIAAGTLGIWSAKKTG